MHAIVNNTVLSNLANVQRPDLLRIAFDAQIVTTSAVFEELTTGERLRRIPRCDWTWLKIIELSDKENALASRFGVNVGMGEATCMAIAQMRRLIFLTDDRGARRLAQSHQISISGTLGILQSLVDDEYLDSASADGLLKQMIAKGYRSPITSLKQLEK